MDATVMKWKFSVSEILASESSSIQKYFFLQRVYLIVDYGCLIFMKNLFKTHCLYIYVMAS